MSGKTHAELARSCCDAMQGKPAFHEPRMDCKPTCPRCAAILRALDEATGARDAEWNVALGGVNLSPDEMARGKELNATAARQRVAKLVEANARHVLNRIEIEGQFHDLRKVREAAHEFETAVLLNSVAISASPHGQKVWDARRKLDAAMDATALDAPETQAAASTEVVMPGRYRVVPPDTDTKRRLETAVKQGVASPLQGSAIGSNVGAVSDTGASGRNSETQAPAREPVGTCDIWQEPHPRQRAPDNLFHRGFSCSDWKPATPKAGEGERG